MHPYLQAAAVAVLSAPLLLAAPGRAANLPIPKPRLPSPNGYDLLMQAGKSIQSGGGGTPGSSEKLSPEEDLRRQRAFTAKNARALMLMKQALRLPIMAPPVRGYDIRFPDYARQRGLSRLGVQQSRVFYADKTLGRAVQSALDVVEIGGATQRGANVIGMLVSTATQAIGLQDLRKWYSECDAATALRAARRLAAIEDRTPPLASVLQEEKWNFLSGLQLTMASPDWKKFRRGDNKALGYTFKDPRDYARVRRFSDLQIQRNLVRAMDSLITQSRRPYSPGSQPLVRAADPMSELSAATEVIGPTRAVYEGARAANRLLATTFALQAFKRERGHYPSTLSELRPKYLLSVPRDPFAPGPALRYKPAGSSFMLYSVGPDGMDNGGKPIEGRGIGVGSRGDMVAGLFG